MMSLKKLNYDLGIKQLFVEWKAFFSTQYLFADLFAGLTVACIGIPLSLAIALASGVPPEVGLVTAIIAGIVCAFFGGTTLAVSGPAAAMSVLLANNVEQFGLKGLVFMCLLAGLMQLFSGIIGLGRLARYVPLPVIAGFTAGIGFIIIVGQLPRIFGLTPPDQSHLFTVAPYLFHSIHQMNFQVLALVALTFAVVRGLPKFFPKIPAPLVAIAVTTAVVFLLHLRNIPIIGAIPDSLPSPHWPHPNGFTFSELFINAFTIFALASLETLLSSTAVDKLSKGEKHNPNQELIGQGLGNIVVSFFAGIPVTGVIARSAVNVMAGAKTRRSSIFQSIAILLAVLVAAPLISDIPIAALAGVLFSVALNMMRYSEIRDLWQISRAEALIYIVTFFTIIFVDLIAGIQVGIVAAGILILIKASQTRLHISFTNEDNALRLSISGTLTFLSSSKIEELEGHLKNVLPGQTVIIDVTGLTNIDSSGASGIIELFNYSQQHSIEMFIKGLPRRFEKMFRIYGGNEILDSFSLISESQLRIKSDQPLRQSFHGRLIHGVKQFQKNNEQQDSRLYEFIAKQQDPHTLFITCSDSRIIPSLITSSDPGELFIIRNVGNFIPTYDPQSNHSEAAAIEFSLGNLHITDIVICGHANCGAMNAVHATDTQHLSPKLRSWVTLIKSQLIPEKNTTANALAKKNVLQQIDNLKTYPIVAEKLANESLRIHAWYFDVETSLIYEWNLEGADFQVIKDQHIDLSQAIPVPS